MFKKKIPDNSKFYCNGKKEIEIEDEDNTLSIYIVDNNKIIEIKLNNNNISHSEKINNSSSGQTAQPIANYTIYEKKLDLTLYLYAGKKFTEEEEKKCKTFMVVGQTDSGKTTFLNALINYYLNVDFDSNIRYVLVNEKQIEKENNKNEGIRKNRDVKYYYLRGDDDQPLLKLIDTPGFGDTIERDKITIEAITKLFQKETFQSINDICFVLQSGINKLSKSQAYVFNQVLCLFGEDLKANFIAIITFSNMNENNQDFKKVLDSVFNQITPHLELLWYYLYDNSCIYKNENKKKIILDQVMKNYKKLVNKIYSLKNINLQKTKDEIDKRRAIENEILSGKFKKKTFLLESSLTSQKDINEIKQIGKNQSWNNQSNEKMIIIKDTNYINDIYYNNKNGFKNLGSTCYMNSFLQILIHIPGFIQKLKEDISEKNNIFYYLFNVAEKPTKENLEKFKQIFSGTYSNYKYYYQEDSQEFGAELLKILNIQYSELAKFTKWKLNGFNSETKTKSIHFEVKKNKLNKLLEEDDCEFKNENFISQFFNFYESESFFCNNKLIHVNYYGDVDNQLSFNLNNTKSEIGLTDLLKDKYSKTLKLVKLPKIFMITLLRAVINQPLIKKKVQIPYELNVKEFLDQDFGNYEESTKYILYALNVCYGDKKRYGHYYSYIFINEKWHKFDDLDVDENVQENQIKKDSQYIYGIYYINEEYLNSLKKNNIK